MASRTLIALAIGIAAAISGAQAFPGAPDESAAGERQQTYTPPPEPLLAGDCPLDVPGTDTPTSSYDTILTSNGKRGYGYWGCVRLCPNNSKAIGFSIRVESPQGSGDDTALNGITIICNDPARTRITSYEGLWGNRTADKYCSNSTAYLQKFELRYEDWNFGIGDNTAANDINFTCSDGQILKGNSPTTWGDWCPMYYSITAQNVVGCRYGIRGIQTRVERWQKSGDDTALNDVAFIC